MTETEWLTCTDPMKMLRFIWRRATARKLRLLQCAWCRRMPYPLTDQRSLTAIEVGERFADGLAHDEERLIAWEAARNVVEIAVAEQQWEQAAGAADARGCVESTKYRIVRIERSASLGHPEQSSILRELLGPLPFRSISFNPGWLVWQSGVVLKLAQSIYDERAFNRMPILADALEEVGCTDAEILNHCRQPGEHVRGCWVIDLILGKS